MSSGTGRRWALCQKMEKPIHLLQSLSSTPFPPKSYLLLPLAFSSGLVNNVYYTLALTRTPIIFSLKGIDQLKN